MTELKELMKTVTKLNDSGGKIKANQGKQFCQLTSSAKRLTIRLFFCLSLFLITPAYVQAAFPGQNGALLLGSISEDRPEESTEYKIESLLPNGEKRRTLLSCSSRQSDCPRSEGAMFPGLNDPVFSPDADQIALDIGDGIGIARADGSNFRELTNLPDNARQPAWSPDGREIVFVASNPAAVNEQSDLFIVTVATGTVRALTTTLAGEQRPTWTARPLATDGRIAYERGRDIWTIKPSGQNARRLTYKSGFDPSFSPYGSKLSFVRRNQIYTVNALGGALDRVTNLGGFSPTWSPNGKRIAFIRSGAQQGSFAGDESRAGLYRMGPRGGALTRFAEATFDSSCDCTFERSLDWGVR